MDFRQFVRLGIAEGDECSLVDPVPVRRSEGLLRHGALAARSPDSVENLEVNTFFAGRETRLRWSGRTVFGSILVGFGTFNLVEGVINHQILGLHHVNETVPRGQWIYWDIGFLAAGAALLVVGIGLLRQAPA